MLNDLLLILAAFAGGAQNAIAGGGSFLTFPALVFAGVPSVAANASSTVALLPGALASTWGYRQDLRPFEGVGFAAIILTNVIGGAIGAGLLLVTPQHTFDVVVPFLLGGATLLFAFGRQLTPFLRRHWSLGPAGLLLVQFLIAVYGGYFGGAIGIMMLALYGIFGLEDLNAMNAMKTLMSGVLNAVAATIFIAAGKIWWHETLLMVVFAILGGYGGARLGRRLDPRLVRIAIVCIGTAITVAFFDR